MSPADAVMDISGAQHSPGDPFIAGGAAAARAHSKQGSGDSGLGGMGSSFPLGRGPAPAGAATAQEEYMDHESMDGSGM